MGSPELTDSGPCRRFGLDRRTRREGSGGRRRTQHPAAIVCASARSTDAHRLPPADPLGHGRRRADRRCRGARHRGGDAERGRPHDVGRVQRLGKRRGCRLRGPARRFWARLYSGCRRAGGFHRGPMAGQSHGHTRSQPAPFRGQTGRIRRHTILCAVHGRRQFFGWWHETGERLDAGVQPGGGRGIRPRRGLHAGRRVDSGRLDPSRWL
jgi:hypothetical protein